MFFVFELAQLLSKISIFSGWNSMCCIHESFFMKTLEKCFFFHFPLTLALSAFAEAWRVECIAWHLQFSIAYCFLIMVWRFSSVGLLSAAVVVFSARDVLCPRHCWPPSPPFYAEMWHLYLSTIYMSHTPTNFYAWSPQKEFTAIFVPPTAASQEQEALRIPAAVGHWVVSIEAGEHGSSSLSPDWWMACLTLSEQDGHCVGWGPEIVTPDCFIRAWLIELSSS